ncbi:MAG: DUF3857 domain-containing protein [Acidobacteriaceae bacterium]|nr:DUF3857 domain-containing protein [Acidobacteriaceae bacterium]
MTSEPKAPGAAAIYLYREEITDEDDRTESIYVRLKVLTEPGRKYGDVALEYLDDNSGRFHYTVEGLEGRTIHSDGTVIPFTGAPYERTLEETHHRKIMQKLFTLPDVQVGSILEYRYTRRCNYGWYFKPTWYVQQNLFVRKDYFLWKTTGDALSWSSVLPDGAQIKTITSEGNIFKSATRSYELTVADVNPIADEEFAPPLHSYTYRVNFYVARMHDDPARTPSEEVFWKTAGKAWSEQAETFLSSPEKMQDALHSLVAPSDTSEEKLKKVYAAVMTMDNTHFSRQHEHAEDQAAGLKPASSTLDVWLRKRGTDEQLTKLFVALARAAGMKAYLMKVTSRDNNIFSSKWLNMSQLDSYVAIVKVDGKEQFFDPGQRYCPYGQLSWMHSGVQGVRQMENLRTEVATTPLGSFVTNQVHRVADLQLDTNGQAHGTISISWSGIPALEWRQMALINDAGTLRNAIYAWLCRTVPAGLHVTLTTVEHLDDYEQPLIANAVVRGPLGIATEQRIIVPGEFFEAQSKPLFAPETRKSPIYFHYGERVLDAVLVKYPAGLTMEAVPKEDILQVPRAVEYDFKVEQKPGSLTVRRRYDLASVIFLPEKYQEVRNFYMKLAADDQQPIVFLRQKGAAALTGGNAEAK